MVVGEIVSGRLVAETARAGHAEPAPLPWPVAVLTIGGLSAGLWAGIGWVVVALF
jgi:hypothetical protein